nr:hypothetical protein [uncultured Microbacterium sp.]
MRRPKYTRVAAPSRGSRLAEAVSATTPKRGLWAEVDPGFHVGNERGRFLGSVTASAEGGFSAFGERSDFLGHFDCLDDAKAAVIAALVESPIESVSMPVATQGVGPAAEAVPSL